MCLAFNHLLPRGLLQLEKYGAFLNPFHFKAKPQIRRLKKIKIE